MEYINNFKLCRDLLPGDFIKTFVDKRETLILSTTGLKQRMSHSRGVLIEDLYVSMVVLILSNDKKPLILPLTVKHDSSVEIISKPF